MSIIPSNDLPISHKMSDSDFTLEDKDFPSPVPVRFLTKEISEDELKNFRPFKVWLAALKSSLQGQKKEDHAFHHAPYTLRSIDIQSADRFGSRGIGFVKLRAEIKNGNNESLPGVAFLRGGSVAILMILRPSDSKNERWVVMTEQPRIPAGSLTFMEIPAGMIEGQSFIGAAADEIEEETGLVIPKTELLDLTELALGKQVRPDDLQSAMYPSPGGSDEYIAIFLWEKVLDRQEIEDLKGKLTGLRTQGEKITVRILNYEQLWKVGARDAKTLAAWSLYEALKRARYPELKETKTRTW